jgi:hypothetical protein
MSLEAIAALLGHRSMRMTMTYAHFSNRTASDEQFRVTEASRRRGVEASRRRGVEANHGRAAALPDAAAGANMHKLAADSRTCRQVRRSRVSSTDQRNA